MFVDYRRAQIPASAAAVFAALQHLTQASLRVGQIDSFALEFFSAETLRLKVTSPLPGQAWLEWKITPQNTGTRLEQTAFFAPHGLPGFWHWYVFGPFYRRELEKLLQRLITDNKP
jgi:hypothetical protein